MSKLKYALAVVLAIDCLTSYAGNIGGITKNPPKGSYYVYLSGARRLPNMHSFKIVNSKDGGNLCNTTRIGEDFKTNFRFTPPFYITVFYYETGDCGPNPDPNFKVGQYYYQPYARGVIDSNTYHGKKYVYFTF